MPAPIRVVIVDDHPAFRRAARELLELRGHAVVGEADCATSAYDVIARCRPELVVLDVHLGTDSGFDVARTLTRKHPALAVVLVSAAEREVDLVLETGARGFVPKWCLATVDLRGFLLHAVAG
jgi:DNA-binding NarL/FixJ family response regulator